MLAARLARQHKLICAAIQAGRIEDLRQMTFRESMTAAEAGKPVFVEARGRRTVSRRTVPKRLSRNLKSSFLPIPKPRFGGLVDVPVTRPSLDSLVERTSRRSVIAATMYCLPDEAVEIVSEMSGSERPANNKLSIELLGEAKFKGGERQDA